MSPLVRSDPEVLRQLRDLAAQQGGTVSRRQAYALGITRWQIKAKVRAGAWACIGDQTIQLGSGPTTPRGELWSAVFQGGPRAMLDGESALVAAGLQRWTATRVRVSVPRGARTRRNARFNIRQTRRWSPDDLATGSSPPRTRTPVAAVRAALWASSNRAAALILSQTVQQGLARAEDLGLEMLRIRRAPRRLLLHVVVNDLLDGAMSLGEQDVTRELARRGLPLPDLQVLRRDGPRRYFLDMRWADLGVVVEVDGIHHGWAENVVADAVRQNALALAGDVVLRLPLLGLRLEPDTFFNQIEAALRRQGWTPPGPRR